MDLIAKLTQSLKGDMNKEQSNFYKAYGGWNQDQSADELITSIRNARTFNRDIEEL